MDVKSDTNNKKEANNSGDHHHHLQDCSLLNTCQEQMQDEASSSQDQEKSNIIGHKSAVTRTSESQESNQNQEKNQTSNICKEDNMESKACSLLQRIHRLQSRQTHRHLHRHVTSMVRKEQTSTGIGCQIQSHRQPLVNQHPVNNFLSNSSVKDHRILQTHLNAVNNDVRLRPSKIVEDQGLSNGQSKTCFPSSNNFNTTFTNITNVNLTNSTVGESPALVKLLVKTSDSSSCDASQVSLVNCQTIPVSCRPSSSSSSTVLCQGQLINGQVTQITPKTTKRVRETPVDPDILECHSGQLKYNLELLEEDYDSDATESSSGGESVVDDFAFTLLDEDLQDSSLSPGLSRQSSLQNHPQSPLPTSTRKHSSIASSVQDTLSWKWSQDRGAIACRWMWLIAQVADLEFKIRQQNDMYRSLRMTKGPIILEAKPDPPPMTPNPASEDSSSKPEGEEEPSQCVRTMPIKNFRKRKLVRSSLALSSVVRKNAKYSTVHCSCKSMPSMASPCVLCNGRNNYFAVIDTDCMSESERMALLDPCCHSVLSLPSQVPLGLHFSKFLKKETTNKSLAIRRQLDRNNKSLNNRTSLSQNHKTPSSTKNNNIRMRMKSLTGSQRDRKTSLSTSGNKFGVKKTVKFGSRERHDSNMSNGSGDSDWTPSLPVKRRRRSDLQDAYDINNIVVDYSIASTTRVEKLQYKEILTPKWREIDMTQETPLVKKDDSEQSIKQEKHHSESNGNLNGNSNGLDGNALDEEMMEDLSDQAYASRHARFEEEEKKRRFLTFLSRPRRESTREGEDPSGKDKTSFQASSKTGKESFKSIRSPVTSMSSPLTSSVGSTTTQSSLHQA